MSRFFQNFEEEKKEVKKKTVEVKRQNEIKLSKHEQKMKEIEKTVEELLNSNKNFEKLFKKFIQELKKSKDLFEDQVPACLLNLFEDPRVKGTNQLKKMSDEFLEGFNKEEEIIVRKETKVNKRKLEDILTMENDVEKEQILVKMFEEIKDLTDSIEKSCEIGVSLFMTYFRLNNPKKMIFIMENLLRFLNNSKEADNSFTRILKKNIDVYLGKIYNILQEEDYDFYFLFLEKLSKINFEGNSEFLNFVKERTWEFDFFKKNKIYLTGNNLFDLMFFVKNNNYVEALELYKNIEFNGKGPSIAIFYELSKLAAYNKGFNLSFNILSSEIFRSNALFDYKIELFSLCVILSQQFKKRIQEENVGLAILDEFLDSFKHFDLNYMLLEAEDKYMEIFRAFYYLENMDCEECSNIILKVSGFDSFNFLKDQIVIN